MELLLDSGADLEAKDRVSSLAEAARCQPALCHEAWDAAPRWEAGGAMGGMRWEVGGAACVLGGSLGGDASCPRGGVATVQSGGTALLWAASNRHNGIVALLLDRGADLEAKDEVSLPSEAASCGAAPGFPGGSRATMGSRWCDSGHV